MSFCDTVFNFRYGFFAQQLPLQKKDMRVTELLRIGERVLEIMSRNNIMRDDFKYLKAYEEFQNMRYNKVKYRSAIKMLADEYNVSERTLERIFSRLSGDC